MGDPTIGGANFYLFYMQHLEYWKELVKDLHNNVSHSPCSSRVTYPKDWVKILHDEYRKLEKEINIVYGEASRIRKLVGQIPPQSDLITAHNFSEVIEQHGLAQARKAGILSILASFFIPIGFVAVSVPAGA